VEQDEAIIPVTLEPGRYRIEAPAAPDQLVDLYRVSRE
jgi:hypothetical protein